MLENIIFFHYLIIFSLILTILKGLLSLIIRMNLKLLYAIKYYFWLIFIINNLFLFELILFYLVCMTYKV
jgi:hypothetical protein